MALNANALTTLDMAKTYLKIPLANTTQDDLVEFFINAASDMLEQETNRKLKAQATTDVIHGRASNIALLTQWPVNSITSLTILNELVDASEYEIADSKNSILLKNRLFPRGYNNVTVVYNAGFATIPADLEHACLWMVFYYHKIRNAEDIGRQTRSKGDESSAMVQEAPLDVKNAIKRYRRNEFAASHSLVWNT